MEFFRGGARGTHGRGQGMSGGRNQATSRVIEVTDKRDPRDVPDFLTRERRSEASLRTKCRKAPLDDRRVPWQVQRLVAVPDSLKQLIDDGVIDDVHERLMSRQRSVRLRRLASRRLYRREGLQGPRSPYLQGHLELHRGAQPDAQYTRQARDESQVFLRQIADGRELARQWSTRRFLRRTYAGVRVPKPIMMYEDVLLMELLLDKDDQPAPTPRRL